MTARTNDYKMAQQQFQAPAQRLSKPMNKHEYMIQRQTQVTSKQNPAFRQ
jgi:hypothetical protein